MCDLQLLSWAFESPKLAACQEFSSLPPAIRCLLDVETKNIMKGKRRGGWVLGIFVGGVEKMEIAHVLFQVCPFAKKYTPVN